MTLVSVIIPTQSRTDMLRAAAASVLDQTFGDLELIIVPNAATAECEAAAREIAASDTRVRVVSKAQPGLAGARNTGLNAATGEWVSFLDDDDIWYQHKLEAQFALIRETGADMVGCPAMGFDERGDIGPLSGQPPPGLTMREAMTVYNWLPGSASGALVRLKTLLDLGGFDERLAASEDWDMWRRVAWNHSIAIPDECLVRYRVHSGSMSRNRWRMTKAEFMVLTKAALDSPRDLLPMVWRGWRGFAFRNLYHAYSTIDGWLLGVPRRVVGRVRAAL